MDFSSESLAKNVAVQLRLASLSDVILGPHGAGLAWSAFMASGRVLVELMPHMRALHSQLCRSSDWGSTPMYAYGGLSLLAGIHHICLLGQAAPGAPSPSPSTALVLELGTWHSSAVRVDVAKLEQVLEESFAYLEGDH